MKFFLPLLLLVTSSSLHSKVEILPYKSNYSWDNSWNEAVRAELELEAESVIMNQEINAEDLKELDCPGYNSVTDNELKKDFWIVFLSSLTRAESGFNTKVRSRGGNIGLLQFSKATARTNCGLKTSEEIAEPNDHLRCGVRMLSWQLEGAPTASGRMLRPDLKGQLFGKHILLWGPLRQNDKSGRKLLTTWFKKHLDQLPFCSSKAE
ncbi:lytic transglycosylase domain-containing protein [Bacteriovorax sp. PP10]|uniref:Lytic transglycosylase domain-containing protein n=1 Tax=Bacteriovorax antarcticus TaxID=3088717 RepID=A0ABU5VX10_9BACT|nr:lytic transglycosylase domain-containing protein [Bacteriovorax sp. PP10]MEA9357492.1 lytic transglycosylase domain-containing protein [Bacteriovorax sp. PP10]